MGWPFLSWIIMPRLFLWNWKLGSFPLRLYVRRVYGWPVGVPKPFFRRPALVLFLLLFLLSCAGDEVLDLALKPPERRQIDLGRMGVNNFFVHRNMASVQGQFDIVKNAIGLRHVRVLFAWTDGIQPAPNVEPDYSFYDEIVSSIPDGVDVVAVVAHAPSWFVDPSSWRGRNPREAWVEQWLEPVVRRYSDAPGILAWEVWNEPDLALSAADGVLGLEIPSNYVDLLMGAVSVLRSASPSKMVVMAATRSIQQNFPQTLDYNKELRDLGVEDLVDVWNVHYYGEQFSKLVQENGVSDFLNSLRLPIWITESGETGFTGQLAYVETVWPFLREKVPSIERIYYYEFASDAPEQENYGLFAAWAPFEPSDLCIYLNESAR